ncbi:hypothetical protein GPECTOR_31g389 [Gonium pectorale]|uniref:Transmembrane protein n=1 Tax=Gonium pectorale TaxID=33097 RepID=A0A150GEM6_GONPE|nr:hypothetical protein GPECTOR_31g389 [Gonium pectorale]|eukprot:KXZ48025.1 hypothetical protein GPECTOR_31g389 [Gonium pectorale]
MEKRGMDCCLVFFRFINFMTAMSAMLCLVAFSMAIVVGPPFTDRANVKAQLLRMYGVVWAAGLVLIETEWEWLMQLCRIMEFWFARGVCQAFLAVMTLELVYSSGNSDFDKSVRLYRTVSGMCLLGCSGFYILGGILCLGTLRNARYKRFTERLRVERDLESLEKQREELSRLLAVYTKE